ncbi:hypothetical protein C8R44DRAFT_875123 [Mycena epipterygia]|nr:hypothetical protein C8R44DRAFT_875123 [Mycena epipterygia]
MHSGLSRRARAATFSVAALSLAASGAPAVRETTISAPTISDYTSAAIAKFLGSHQADSAPFNVKGPWTAITFSGTDSTQMTPEAINNLVFNANKYKDFIQDMNKVASIGAPTANQTAAAAAMGEACSGPTISNTLNQALTAYNAGSSTPMNNVTDPKFLSWAQDSYPSYGLALQNCTAQTLALDKLTDITEGDDASVYTGAYAHIKPLIDANAPAVGIVMAISNLTGTIGSTGGKGQEAGDYVAYYDIPTLNTTLSKWQAGSGLAPFSYYSTSQNYSAATSTKFGGASFGLTFEKVTATASAGTSSTQSSSEVKASTFGLSFAGLALVGLNQGAWFDGYRVARAAEAPDSTHTAVKLIFSNETYFGSQQQPGPLAAFNYQALVGFRPSWTIQLEDSSSSSSQQSSEGGGGISILGLAEIGGYGGKSSAKVNVDNSTNTVTITDDTNNAYIVGFVQQTYWA